MHLDIDERHLLRLGHGEEMLETEKDFSRYGRVNYVLQQRLALLKEVNRLQKSLGVQGDVSYTCETAGHFYLYQVLSRWEKFQDEINLHKKTVEGKIQKNSPNRTKMVFFQLKMETTHQLLFLKSSPFTFISQMLHSPFSRFKISKKNSKLQMVVGTISKIFLNN